MLIRKNPVLSCDEGEEDHQSRAQLAIESITAISTFIRAYPRNRSSGYFLSTALVECICHLLYIVQDRAARVDRSTLINALRDAHRLLSELSSICVTAKRAVNVLFDTISPGSDVDVSQPTNHQNEESTRAARSDNSNAVVDPGLDRQFGDQAFRPAIDFMEDRAFLEEFNLPPDKGLHFYPLVQQPLRSCEGVPDLIGNFRNDLGDMDLDSLLEIWPQNC